MKGMFFYLLIAGVVAFFLQGFLVKKTPLDSKAAWIVSIVLGLCWKLVFGVIGNLIFIVALVLFVLWIYAFFSKK